MPSVLAKLLNNTPWSQAFFLLSSKAECVAVFVEYSEHVADPALRNR